MYTFPSVRRESIIHNINYGTPVSLTLENVFSDRLPDDLPDDAPVLPRAIAAACSHPRLDCRQYISFGQECPICMEPITSSRNAHLTSCGHGFHVSCLIRAKAASNDAGTRNCCPMCRHRMGLDIEYLCDRYSDDAGSIDAVENFWLKYPNMAPVMCGMQRTHSPHALGVRRDCRKCQEYRTNGCI
jgi:hypothetical protein